MNGDGFGLGWYGESQDAFVFRDTSPAWADENFEAIAKSVISPLYFVHCRAATGTETSRSNCHPFRHGRFMFMHNGQIGGYSAVRRSVESMILDRFYAGRRGTSDSEAIFLATISRVHELGVIDAFGSVIRDILGLQRAHNIKSAIRFCAAFSDGETLWAFRWASDSRPPSLYTRCEHNSVLVASEPIDRSDKWETIPQGSCLEIRGGSITRQIEFNPAAPILARTASSASVA